MSSPLPPAGCSPMGYQALVKGMVGGRAVEGDVMDVLKAIEARDAVCIVELAEESTAKSAEC